MLFDNLTADNFTLYLIKAYDSPHLIMSELRDDIRRIFYVKRLLKKYRKSDCINVQLIINHLIVIFNVFGPEAGQRALFFKIPESEYHTLIPCLLFLNMCSPKIYGINGKDIIISDYYLDNRIIAELRKKYEN